MVHMVRYESFAQSGSTHPYVPSTLSAKCRMRNSVATVLLPVVGVITPTLCNDTSVTKTEIP
jgi:hypothetical protein